MLTSGSKYLFGSALLALVGAFFVAIATSGHTVGMAELTGAISLGYKGPIGDHFAYAMLVGYAGVAILIGAILSVTRDGDPERGAQLQGLEAPAPVLPVRGTNHWPLIGAFGASMIILGLVYSQYVFIFGMVVCGISVLQWSIYAWADRATADPFANRRIRQQLTYPLDFPLFAIVAIFLFVFGISRILIAFSEGMDVIIFGGVPAVAFVIAIILSYKPKLSRNLIAGLAVAGCLAVLGLGVAGMVKGPAEVEKHENTPHPFKIQEASLGAPVSVRIAGEETR